MQVMRVRVEGLQRIAQPGRPRLAGVDELEEEARRGNDYDQPRLKQLPEGERRPQVGQVQRHSP